MRGGSKVEVRLTLRQALGQRDGARSVSIEGQDDGTIQRAAFMIGEKAKSALNLLSAVLGLTTEMIGPRKAGLQPG